MDKEMYMLVSRQMSASTTHSLELKSFNEELKPHEQETVWPGVCKVSRYRSEIMKLSNKWLIFSLYRSINLFTIHVSLKSSSTVHT